MKENARQLPKSINPNIEALSILHELSLASMDINYSKSIKLILDELTLKNVSLTDKQKNDVLSMLITLNVFVDRTMALTMNVDMDEAILEEMNNKARL